MSSMSSRSRASRASSACARFRRFPAPSSRWTPIPAASTRWSAASPTTRASSTAPPRPCASRARRSSRSSMRRRSTTATRLRASVLDAPFTLDMGPGQEAWAPSNYDGKSAGPRTLRYGVEHSKNLMTVRLAKDVGMPLDRRICPPLRRLRRPAAGAVDVARRRRDHGHAHDGRLFDVRQWRPPHQADADRPHPGPHRADDLPPRRPQMHRLRRGRVGRPGTSPGLSTTASRSSIR